MYYCNQIELDALGEEFRDKQVSLIYHKCLNRIGVNPFDLESIKAASVGVKLEENQNVIYFLFDDEELVYIGQSKLGKTRLIKHIKEAKKTFNSFYILPVKLLGQKGSGKLEKLYPLDVIEFMLIVLYSPKYNQTINDRTKNVVNIKSLMNQRVRFHIDSCDEYRINLIPPTVKELYDLGIVMPFAVFKGEEYVYKPTIRAMEMNLEITLMGYTKLVEFDHV